MKFRSKSAVLRSRAKWIRISAAFLGRIESARAILTLLLDLHVSQDIIRARLMEAQRFLEFEPLWKSKLLDGQTKTKKCRLCGKRSFCTADYCRWKGVPLDANPRGHRRDKR